LAERPFTWLDVFTAQPLTGNGLAVVHDADGLDDATMLAFAGETRLSETTFVQSPTEPGADYRNRIFMPGREIPFAGHPSLGTAVAVARARGETEASYVQQTHAGLQPIDVELSGTRARASMLQEPAVMGEELDEELVLRALGLEGIDADRSLPCQVVSTGVNQVLACVHDPAAVARAWPNYDATAALIGSHQALVVYLAAVDREAGTAVARGFSESAVMGEDPATGSAAGPLMAHVFARTGCERLEIVQGVEMGRRSVLRCAIEGERVRVGGDAVVFMHGHVDLDA
jgi:trans-2,3-dihydro-3-hydroxyanthranilate isomerase